jgi:ribose/xylose/arabinose/galactoside ABC-type transport system permease subunit/ABC-type sugar transport system substrate-binding protein
MRCVRGGGAILPNGSHSRWVLLALIAEIGIFSVFGHNFFTAANLVEVLRLSVELGLLALAMTPVIITGGIDLSVGSMMGLCAVVFGALVMEWHWPVAAAMLATLLIGCVGGALNGALIAEFKIPPLIVTLGTFSAFRGIAEGITHGAVNYSGFLKSFLFLGQGYVLGMPAQLPILLIAVASYAVLLHRSVIGRGLYAIGFAGRGARYAGIGVERRIGLVYLLSGVSASVAAIVYVAHLGQAKSDAGTGYELDAITAVVLGGASVAGGRGTILGTVLGLFSISILQNGLHLAALPSELTGILTGVVLVVTIAMDRMRAKTSKKEEAGEMKNSQVAILCAAILVGALITAGSNVWLVKSLKTAPAVGTAIARPIIAVMPKAKGDPYFVSCRIGAEEAARELGVELIWDGPTGLDAAKQNEIVESWITRGVDAIAVAVENQAGISTVLRKARGRGIHVLTWDADAEPDAREYFLNQATPEGIGNALTDEAARLLGGKGEFAIITGALSAANQNQWIAFIKKRVDEKHSGLKLVTIRPSDDDRDKAFSETQTILKVHPEVKLIMAISAPAVPGAGEAIRQAGRKEVDVIGLSLPGISKPYIHDGSVQTIFLWNTKNLGYLTVYTGMMLARNQIPAGATSIQAGRLGTLQVRDSEIILGAPLLIDRRNIDSLDF